MVGAGVAVFGVGCCGRGEVVTNRMLEDEVSGKTFVCRGEKGLYERWSGYRFGMLLV